jgi:hypothetical protein
VHCIETDRIPTFLSRRIGYRHFHQHALGSESLGSVRSDSVAMIEVPRSVGAGPEISALRQHFDVVIFFCSLFHHSGFPKSRDEIGSCCDMGSVSRVSVRRAHFLFSLEKTDFIRGPVNGAGSRSKLTQKFLHCPHGPTSMRFRLPILPRQTCERRRLRMHPAYSEQNENRLLGNKGECQAGQHLHCGFRE